MDKPEEIAEFINTKRDLKLKGATLVAVPVKVEDEIPFEKMDLFINEALKECYSLGINGKRITPFLLDKVKTLTEGRSLETNIKLVLNNASIGAQIACNIK